MASVSKTRNPGGFDLALANHERLTKDTKLNFFRKLLSTAALTSSPSLSLPFFVSWFHQDEKAAIVALIDGVRSGCGFGDDSERSRALFTLWSACPGVGDGGDNSMLEIEDMIAYNR